MPNWVSNRITITGGKDALDALEQKLHSEETPFSFGALVPRPSDKEEDWYNWNTSNWGTKWDACEAHKSRVDDTTLEYQFETAWSPPGGVIDALFNQHPDLDYEYLYEEEQGWGGSVVFKGGAVIEQGSYDVPDSHKEMAERRGGCWCTPAEASFDDCFAEQIAARGDVGPDIIEAVRGLSPGWGGTIDELLEAAMLL